MKKIVNADLRLAAGLALRTDMRYVINEVIDRLNEVLEKLEFKEIILSDDVDYQRFLEYYQELQTIFNFLYACQIMSKRGYRLYHDEMYNIFLDLEGKKVGECIKDE